MAETENNEIDQLEQLRAEFQEELAQNDVKIEEPRSFEPIVISYDVFGSEAEDLKKWVGQLEEWLKKPYVTDQFGTTGEGHSRRAKWRQEMEQKYGEQLSEQVDRLFHGGKYSANAREGVSLACDLLVIILLKNEKFIPLATRIRELLDQSPSFDREHGENIELNELRKRTEQLEDSVYKILLELSTASKPS